jgi:hypothetical protein
MINEKDFLKNGKIEKPETKEDLQIKKLKLQIEQLEEKKKQQAQKQQEQQKVSKLQATSDIIKALLYLGTILLAPLFIMGGFLLACAKASGGTSRGKRY